MDPHRLVAFAWAVVDHAGRTPGGSSNLAWAVADIAIASSEAASKYSIFMVWVRIVG